MLLSTEERRTLIQEGLPVPTKLPLSKQEEEALKIVRRKIKNKVCAFSLGEGGSTFALGGGAIDRKGNRCSFLHE